MAALRSHRFRWKSGCFGPWEPSAVLKHPAPVPSCPLPHIPHSEGTHPLCKILPALPAHHQHHPATRPTS